MSPRLTAAITVAIHELKRRPYSTIRNDTVAELEAALAAEPHEMPDANKVDALVAERDLAVYEQDVAQESLRQHQVWLQEAQAERDALRAWQEKAFQAHPNIDLDIDAAITGEQK